MTLCNRLPAWPPTNQQVRVCACQEGGYARKGLDLRHYQLLQRDVHRLERFLKR